ncbi:MAG: VPLPA-CTERM sorting domain-containing protein [Methylococcaceae bacterium]|nr:VPLPA-CTERM sorting domain-containing protein [Methylococcaceae bacterium]
MKICMTLRASITSALVLSSFLFSASSQASLTSIGNGLIYDDVSNVTWISDGHAFTNNIAGSTSNPVADPYTGPLLGTVVTPSLGSPHTIAASDFMYENTSLFRWMGSWWAATAWADNFTYQYGSQTISNWRLPTSGEAQALITQLGAGSGAISPFTWVPPFYWTSNLTSATNADVARPLFGTINNFTLMNGAVPRYSNVWAVVPGNVASVPVPAAVWLFGSALGGLGAVGRRRVETKRVG